ncbi:hypothetical protein Vadar_025979 [Vaccinium darrowii]|uniref:Uncharacterized protein n=1 Tax=Vaccinium darrowii TaxID=229202 RepID=A0ACB7YRR7_9ERIC|nr:hypothetical protein Vadar_025979 [Vaccinium darrowii]
MIFQIEIEFVAAPGFFQMLTPAVSDRLLPSTQYTIGSLVLYLLSFFSVCLWQRNSRFGLGRLSFYLCISLELSIHSLLRKSYQMKSLNEENLSNKEIVLQQALHLMTTSFGKGSITWTWLGRFVSPIQVAVVYTGSCALDMALGIGGIPKGRVVEIYGLEASVTSALKIWILFVAVLFVGQQIGCSILVGNFNLVLGLHDAHTLLDFSQAMCFPWFSKDLRMISLLLLSTPRAFLCRKVVVSGLTGSGGAVWWLESVGFPGSGSGGSVGFNCDGSGSRPAPFRCGVLRWQKENRALRLPLIALAVLALPPLVRIMPKVKTNRVKYPEGWELIEPTLRELQAKMREAENDPHDGKRKCEALWPIFKIAHQKSRYIFDLYHRRKEISKELYEFCMDQGYADRNLIAKWKKPGYERLCCLRCMQPRDHNFQTTCVCRVPKHLREEKVIECVHCGCRGCASGD